MRCNGNPFFHLWRTPTPESKHCDAAQARGFCALPLSLPSHTSGISSARRRRSSLPREAATLTDPRQHRVFVPQAWNEGQTWSHEARLASALMRRGETDKRAEQSPTTHLPHLLLLLVLLLQPLISDSPLHDKNATSATPGASPGVCPKVKVHPADPSAPQRSDSLFRAKSRSRETGEQRAAECHNREMSVTHQRLHNAAKKNTR